MNNINKNDGWIRMSFKGNKVWVACKPDGEIDKVDDKVLIKYNLKQDYEYRIKPESLQPVEMAVPSKSKKGSKKSSTGKSAVNDNKPLAKPLSGKTDDIPENSIRIYTDGASSGNPGPAGIGVLLIFKDNKREISKYIGNATNNIAELTAVKIALEELKRYDLPVRIYSDSSYSIGLLSKGWKPKKNQELVQDIRNLMDKFHDLTFIKVKGHAGIPENEVADKLATSAIKKGRQ